MGGKSTYIRSAALMTVMAQIRSFVPALYASFLMVHQLFARVSMDDSIEANVCTFISEMIAHPKRKGIANSKFKRPKGSSHGQ
jgi:DNA mismatch repair protein MSH4